ncbi:hypothetical protein GALL_384370 [mine drainage metagenome]|uniref:Uncharacterized protein n=1 Tax=mine drainage metagenome TaxID=410659 RepID=A0A1J5Q8Z2_9ZZZZ
MRGVQLDQLEAHAHRAPRGFDEAFADAAQPRGIERLRRRFGVAVGQCRRRHAGPAAGVGRQLAAAVPGHPARRLAPGVRQLDADRNRRVLAQRVEHPPQRRLVGVGPQAEVARRDAPDRLDRGGLDDQQPGARQRELAEVDQVPVAGAAVVGRVLAHRRDRDAVGQLELAEPDRAEQRAHRRGTVNARRASSGARCISCRRPGYG